VARGYRRKRYYATPVRILTHLSSTAAHEPGTLSALTQEGIASATHSGRTTATKWLARLESDGIIAGERAHVPGHRVRKTIYRLTHDGWVHAMKLRTRFQSDVVEVIAPGLDSTLMQVAEIPEIFPAYVNLTAAVSLIRGGRLDFTRLHGIGSGAVAPVLWGDTLRRLGRLFGRVEEFRTLDAWSESPTTLLVVSGIAGIGKSALVASWLVRQRPRPYIYWFEINDGATRAVFLRDLAAFLARLGRRGLKNLLEEQGNEEPHVTARVLAHDLQALPILFVLDNFQASTPDLARLVTGPILNMAFEASVKILLISRATPTSLVRRKGPKGLRVEVLRLEGLDLPASIGLLRSKGFAGDESALERAASSARGHPIRLSFAAQTGSAVSGEMTRYLEREIWRTLTKGERTILEAASLFRGLVPLDGLHCFSSDWQTAVHGLQAKNILAPTISGGVVVHDTIRDYIRERISEARRRSFHSLAAMYFLDGSEMRERLEGMYHLMEAGDMKAFGAYLVSNGTQLLDSVPAPDLLRVLRSVDGESLEPLPACILPEILGDILRTGGDLQPALQEYRHAVQGAEAHARPERIPRLLRKIGAIERWRDEFPKAYGHFVEARARLESYPDPAERGELLREMALLEQAKGELAAAAVHMNESVDLATEVTDPGPLARSLTGLGLIEARRGNSERALEFKFEALRVAERGGNLTETARSSISAGVSLHYLERHEEALKYYDRALQIARLVGNIRLQGYALMNRCAAMLDLGLYQDAGPILEEAKRFVRIMEEPSTIALLDVSEGQREMGLGRWNRAVRIWDRGLNTLKQRGDLFDYARSLTYVARFYLDKQEFEQTRRLLEEAKAIAHRLGGTSLIDTIERIRERLPGSREIPPPTAYREGS
jgi:tetratricopeptide (TPR) repeat protein